MLVEILTVAAMFAGRPVTISDDLSEYPCNTATARECIAGATVYGYTEIEEGVIHIAGYHIEMLKNISTVQPYQSCLAVLVFAHEIAHARGIRDEIKAERWAVLHTYRIARYLGAPMKKGREIITWLKWWNKKVGA